MQTTEAKAMFSRQEALKLSGLTSGQLSRLDASKTVVPTKYGSGLRPAVVYSFDQVILLRFIARLTNQLSMQETKRIATSLAIDAKLQGIPHLNQYQDRYLIIGDEVLCWTPAEEIGAAVVDMMCGKGHVSLKVVTPVGDVFSDLEGMS